MAMNSPDFATRFRAVASQSRVALLLLGLILLYFFWLLLHGAGLLQVVPEVHVAWGSNFGPLTLGGQSWRLLSNLFIHFGVIHLAFNSLALWQLGPLAERLFGSAHFLLLYLLAGVAGSVASLLWNPLVNSAGASGAIFGLIGGLLAFLSRRNLGVPGGMLLALRRDLLTFGGFSLFYGLVQPGIDNAAHIGGLIAGFLAGLALARPTDAKSRSGNDLVRLLAVAVVGLTVLAGVFLAIS